MPLAAQNIITHMLRV